MGFVLIRHTMGTIVCIKLLIVTILAEAEQLHCSCGSYHIWALKYQDAIRPQNILETSPVLSPRISRARPKFLFYDYC